MNNKNWRITKPINSGKYSGRGCGYPGIKTVALLSFLLAPFYVNAQPQCLSGIRYIDYYFENASPLNWFVQGDSIIKILLPADYERERFNRQTDHWYFRIDATPETRIRFILSKTLPDIYNGKPALAWWNAENGISCYISYDGQTWDTVKTTALPGHELLVDFISRGESVYVARLPVYTEKNLDQLKNRIINHTLVEFIPIGHTVENRPLEIIRLGDPNTSPSILIRARAHPWEPGGNWVVEGLIHAFLKENSLFEKWRSQFCLYILPMANKDGVFHGVTRFNAAGRDLNRNWLSSNPDSLYSPENYALMQFLTVLNREGHKISLAIDFHNDNEGDVHLTIPQNGDDRYLKNMERLKQILIQNTWFTRDFKINDNLAGGGSMADGLYARFGIDALIFELNANYIEKLGKMPEIQDYMELGARLNQVFYQYLLPGKE